MATRMWTKPDTIPADQRDYYWLTQPGKNAEELEQDFARRRGPDTEVVVSATYMGGDDTQDMRRVHGRYRLTAQPTR